MTVLSTSGRLVLPVPTWHVLCHPVTAGAVTNRRLIHNLRKRKIPKRITDWVNSFLNERSTTLVIHSRVTGIFDVKTDIP